MEIKFRALKDDMSNPNFVYGQLVYDAIGQPRIAEVDKSGQGLTFHTCIKGTEGQLWKPSLNLELYTGDLFKAVCSVSGSKVKKERICKVDFENTGMCISVWHKGEWWGYGSMDFTSAKLIGNVHENQELLTI